MEMTTPTSASQATGEVAAASPAAQRSTVLESLLQLPPPIVQVSIDVPTVEQAIEVGHMALRAGVDLLEFGTPLVLNQGLSVLGRFKAAFPDSACPGRRQDRRRRPQVRPLGCAEGR